MPRHDQIAALQIAHHVSRQDARTAPSRDLRIMHHAFACTHKTALLALGGLPA